MATDTISIDAPKPDYEGEAQATPWYFHLLFAIPVLGSFLKGIYQPDVNGKLLGIANLVMLWLLAALIFGYPGFFLPVLAMVPVVVISIFQLLQN